MSLWPKSRELRSSGYPVDTFVKFFCQEIVHLCPERKGKISEDLHTLFNDKTKKFFVSHFGQFSVKRFQHLAEI